jgi:NAD(P)-dependent dehydrogenase (short-subunit alcohol dehydrogenase family)
MGDVASLRRFEDDVVLVTGSTRGIGRAIARRFCREGASVVVTGRRGEDGEEVAAELDAEGTAMYIPANLRDVDELEALVRQTGEEFGHIDVLVNNAGVETETSVTEATLDDWEYIVETDFRAFWLCAKHASEYMPPGSSIVNVSSNHALLTMPRMFPYNAVKAGIDGMTRGMALDLGPTIRVNTVNPGWIAVERTLDTVDQETLERLESIHPVGRIGEPSDVAGVVTFLASDDASFVTGAQLLVDGGRTAVMQDDRLPDYARLRAEPVEGEESLGESTR